MLPDYLNLSENCRRGVIIERLVFGFGSVLCWTRRKIGDDASDGLLNFDAREDVQTPVRAGMSELTENDLDNFKLISGMKLVIKSALRPLNLTWKTMQLHWSSAYWDNRTTSLSQQTKPVWIESGMSRKSSYCEDSKGQRRLGRTAF